LGPSPPDLLSFQNSNPATFGQDACKTNGNAAGFFSEALNYGTVFRRKSNCRRNLTVF
jgi:hypothetical protein